MFPRGWDLIINPRGDWPGCGARGQGAGAEPRELCPRAMPPRAGWQSPRLLSLCTVLLMGPEQQWGSVTLFPILGEKEKCHGGGEREKGAIMFLPPQLPSLPAFWRNSDDSTAPTPSSVYSK